MVDGEPRPWLPSSAPAMDEITFKSDTVLSDVHLHTPNQRHLMVRLSGVGQPVFLSQFKLLWNQASQTYSGAEGGNHRAHHTEVIPPAMSPPGSGCSSEGVSFQAGVDATSQEGVAAQLDEDGDLDVVRRPRAASPSKPSGPPRDKVHPMILTQEEDDVLGDEARESGPYDVIKIEHTMATPLEDVGKQVWRGALLLADYILSQRDLFQGRTVLELGAGTGLASILAATVAQTVYCTDVGADLLAMCQRNIALNSHLTATGGRRALPGLPSSCLTCPSIQSDLSKMHLTPSLPAEHLPGVKSELFLWLQTSWSGPGRLFLPPVLAAPLSSTASSEPQAHFTCSALCPELPRPCRPDHQDSWPAAGVSCHDGGAACPGLLLRAIWGTLLDPDRVIWPHGLQSLQRFLIALGVETQLLGLSGPRGVWPLPVGSPFPTAAPSALAILALLEVPSPWGLCSALSSCLFPLPLPNHAQTSRQDHSPLTDSPYTLNHGILTFVCGTS
nr:methyltransferase-like protein 22 isoform X2 [Kogia breviceps]XP_058894415.1 methyltransferase-like protein 22 isoform X2 [Kogia breviceps]